jgi:putative Ca2+/H+ antiporter (TMEM165/GDT1 family)
VSVPIALICFPAVLLAELPDKTMFANLVMATNGRPRQVWLGAAGAFLLHVTIAVSIGEMLVMMLPRRAMAAVVAGLFLLGAVAAGCTSRQGSGRREAVRSQGMGVALTAFVVIFVAEWGDLTQVLIADLAVRYHAALSVAVGALAALWTVAAIAVTSGQLLLRHVEVRTIRRVTAVVAVFLAAYSAWSAVR